MTKKKWLYLILIVVLALPILLLYNAFNGNPLSKQISKYTLKNHLENTYPEDEFTIGKPIYNFKNGGYDYEVRKVGDPAQKEFEFIVTGIFGTDVHYDAIYYDNQDTILIEKLEKEAGEELSSLFKEKMPEIIYIGVGLEILKERYPSDTVWTKDFKPEKPMTIFFAIDAHTLTRENLLEKASLIQRTLNDEGYTYDNVNINANIYDEQTTDEEDGEPFGYVKYAIWFEQYTKLKLKHVQ